MEQHYLPCFHQDPPRRLSLLPRQKAILVPLAFSDFLKLFVIFIIIVTRTAFLGLPSLFQDVPDYLQLRLVSAARVRVEDAGACWCQVAM